MPFHRVLDITVALLVEVYRELGLKFDEIMDELDNKLTDTPPGGVRTTRRPPPEAANDASMAMLTSMVAGSTFKGAGR